MDRSAQRVWWAPYGWQPPGFPPPPSHAPQQSGEGAGDELAARLEEMMPRVKALVAGEGGAGEVGAAEA